jgi:hypothetical protein
MIGILNAPQFTLHDGWDGQNWPMFDSTLLKSPPTWR